MSSSQSLGTVSAIAICAILGTLAFAYVRQNNVDVYFDNGLEEPVTVSVDGESFPLSNRMPKPLKHQLSPGDHEVVVTGAAGEIEREHITVDERDLLTALLSSDFYVYNVAAAHIYRRAHHTYAAKVDLRDYQEQLFAFEHFFSQPDAEFLFVPAPETITIEGDTARRDEFVIARELDYAALAMAKLSEGNVVEANRAVAKALELGPCNHDAFRTHVLVATIDERTEELPEFARSWITACDGEGVEAHRAYQDAMLGLDREALLADYGARRRRAATAEADYLYGRLLSGAPALEMYEAALEKDPNLVRARIALAYELMALERAEEAENAARIAMGFPAYVPEVVELYAHAAIASGHADEVHDLLWQVGNRHPNELAAWEARFSIALAREDWNEAERLRSEYQSKTSDEGLEFEVRVLLQRGELEQAERRLELAAARPDLSPSVATMRFQVLFDAGRFAEAASSLEELDSPPDAIHRIYAAAGLTLAGDRAGARTELEALETDWGVYDEGLYHSLIQALRGAGSDEAVLEAARADGYLSLPHAYFVLGARARVRGDRRRAAAYFLRAAETAVHRGFPYVASRRIAEM